jgi:hypothetical protein
MQSNPGIRVSGYRIEARIGRGGMGEVYRAEQLSLGRKVALKVLRPDLAADDGFRRRFLRESMIAAAIDHPSVIPIYDAGEVDGLLYIAMRYVDGSDLSTLLRREGRLDLARTLAIMTQVAGALDAAHARGLVHRDVKPSNILLAPAAGGGEYCYLCDFGLIKQTHAAADTPATATDQLVGSVPYVAPEQVDGGEVDGRTDVYSLGCSIFHCLAGSVPYQGQTDVEVIFAHLRGEPPPLSSRVAGLPPALDGVIARAMARSKEDRYLTCSALVAAAAALVPAGGRVRAPLVDDETRSLARPLAAAGPVAAGTQRPPPARRRRPPCRRAPRCRPRRRAGGPARSRVVARRAGAAAGGGRRLPGRHGARGADREPAADHADGARDHRRHRDHRRGHDHRREGGLRLDRAGAGRGGPAEAAGRHARQAGRRRPVRRRRDAHVHRPGPAEALVRQGPPAGRPGGAGPLAGGPAAGRAGAGGGGGGL